MQNGDYSSQTKSSRVLKLDTVDNREAVNVCEQESSSHEPQIQGAAVPTPKDQPCFDTQKHKVGQTFPFFSHLLLFFSFCFLLFRSQELLD